MPRANPKRPPRKLVTRRCGACHNDFDTTRQKATRCPQCISQGRRVRYRNCFECGSAFVLFDDTHRNCTTCSDALGLDPSELSPEQLAKCTTCADALGLDPSELSPEQLERLKEQERLAKFTQARDRQLAWLTQRDKARPARHDDHNHQYDLTSLGLI